MSSLANKAGSQLISAVAAAAGIGAFALPLTAPWYLFIIVSAAMAVIAGAKSAREYYLMGALTLTAVVLVLLGHLPAPLAAAALAATALGRAGRIGLALVVLVVDLSTVTTVQELTSNALHRAELEAASPALIAAALLLFVAATTRHAAGVIAGGIVSTFSVWLGNRIATTPDTVLALGALPIILAAAFMAIPDPPSRRTVIPIAAVFAVALLVWVWTPPRTGGEIWLLLPDHPEAYEAKYFRNYVEALAFAGINAKKASNPEEVPSKAVVLIPWLTASFADQDQIGKLAQKRRWTVIAGGEHTDMGGVATRVKAMTGRILLRRDLTTPPANTDHTGPLRMPGLLAWPHESILNRGSSVTISSLTDKVILAGDGWWAEPDLEEWLWVGDYIWRRSDRAGRLTLAASSDINGARWLVVGDNSPLMNQQLYADPRAALRLIQAATLWPTFAHDFLLVLLGVVVVLGGRSILIGAILISSSTLSILSERTSKAWTDIYLGETGFDERNFNVTLAKYPALITGRRLIRLKAAVSGDFKLPQGAATLFLLVDGSVRIGGVRLDKCHRIGSLATSEGPYLMDAQACRVVGEARVLIGTADAAAAIAVPSGNGEVIAILDTAFLSQKAPNTNSSWLLKEIGR